MADEWYDPFNTKPNSVVSSLGNFARQPAGPLFAGTRPATSTGVYVSPMTQPYKATPAPPAPAYDSRATMATGTARPTGGTPVGGTDIETRRATNVAGRPQMGISAEEEASNILGLLDGLNFPTTPRGSGLTSQQEAAMRAIQTLQGRLTAPSETDALQARLADIYKQAEDRIRAAGAELGGTLSTPTVARQTSAMTPVGNVAMSDYLSAIGASGADVSAQQALSNAILGNIAGNAQQYSTGLTQANDVVRQALAGAVPANQLAGISQASLNRAALEARLAAQQSKDRQAIQDQILELALKYGVKY
jgi:hypothetical protein